jgi:hypothetical protein
MTDVNVVGNGAIRQSGKTLPRRALVGAFFHRLAGRSFLWGTKRPECLSPTAQMPELGNRIMTEHEPQAGFVPEIDWQVLVFWALLISTASGAP